MLTRSQKSAIVGELEDKFRRQRVLIFTDIRGVPVAKLTALRRELKKIGSELKVAKKTLLRRALETAGLAFGAIEPKSLEGEIAVIFGYEDQVAPAKIAATFGRENETFKMLKGLLTGKILEAGEVLALAKLPSRNQLLGQLACALNAPMRGLANVLVGNIRNLVVVLDQIKQRRE